jgi:hypothetical protein
MSYVNCPRCRLTVRLREDSLAPEYCPRCASKHGVHSKVYLSATPARLFTRPTEPAVEAPRPAAPA